MKTRALTRSEIKAILGVANNDRDRALIVLSSNTGLRATEIVSLRIDDLAIFKNARLKGIRDVIYISTKGQKMRSIKLNSDAKKELKNYIGILLKKGCEKDSFVFTAINTKSGVSRKHITRQRFFQITKELAELAIGTTKGIACHSFRKAYATALYFLTKDINYVCSMLNHSSPTTTWKYIASSIGLYDDQVENLGFT